MSFVRVLKVNDASFALLKKNPPDVVVFAEGEVSTSGWSNGQLGAWIYVSPPTDGILDLDFVAKRPSGFVAQVISNIGAQITLIDIDIMNYWGNAMPLTGFRIHSATNTIEIEFNKIGKPEVEAALV